MFRSALISTLLLLAVFGAHAKAPSQIPWQPWTDAAFAEAKKNGKLLILDLEAVWCHWCHVMDEKTYADPNVVKLIKDHFIPLRVDQDARPDLSRRYQDYGWPATIFFNADGQEIVKRAGYIEPQAMARLLQAIVDDPTPEAAALDTGIQKFAKSALLSNELRERLLQRHLASFDPQYGGLKLRQKFLDRDTVEYDLLRASQGDAQNEQMAKKTLDEALALIDPVWGGVYQYSTGGKWDYPHFEKVMAIQAGYLRIYALAYSHWQAPRYLAAAKAIAGYMQSFLSSPDGAFYTSQDADLIPGQHSRDFFALSDAERRKKGIPRVDKHRYARENGWAISAFVHLYGATGEEPYLRQAKQAAHWIIQHRRSGEAGFSHDSADPAGPYLGDNIAMAQAMLDVYQFTGERSWLVEAEKTARFIRQTFANPIADGKQYAGFVTAKNNANAVVKWKPQIDENISVARFAARLYHYTGNTEFKSIGKIAMRYLATPAVATERLTEAGILLIDHELNNDPTHITVVGHKDDPLAQQLFAAANRYPSVYKRIEWWDTREGPMPNPDVQYPEMQQAAAFACSNSRCSLPVFKPEKIQALVDRLNNKGSVPTPNR